MENTSHKTRFSDLERWGYLFGFIRMAFSATAVFAFHNSISVHYTAESFGSHIWERQRYSHHGFHDIEKKEYQTYRNERFATIRGLLVRLVFVSSRAGGRVFRYGGRCSQTRDWSTTWGYIQGAGVFFKANLSTKQRNWAGNAGLSCFILFC